MSPKIVIVGRDKQKLTPLPGESSDPLHAQVGQLIAASAFWSRQIDRKDSAREEAISSLTKLGVPVSDATTFIDDLHGGRTGTEMIFGARYNPPESQNLECTNFRLRRKEG